ncbi:2-haloacid dehalogenase [Prauserella sediminis]|uniref:2-haloacid dehalogenase n=1 Tax=Prauserella sediminis TaxID=577680 RepID=A0A839XZL6_9PSEU|nr:haloacid dehalogenase type II [Prauserella sediminis]MBB3665476.1 2-haloacid dehalogenase [Prauserella sediminis]
MEPKFVSFDMNGTLIDFRINDAIRRVLGDRLPVDIASDFLRVGNAYRIDECMGEWKSFQHVVGSALERTARRFGVTCDEHDAKAVYDEIPTWRPYPGVTEALNRLAQRHALVIVSNTDDEHAPRLVENLGAPFDVVITAEQMGVYKPRLRAFDYMLDRLGVAPDEIVHVSSSPKYDLRPADDIGITNKVYVDRGREPDQPWLGYERIDDIADLPDLLAGPRR